MDNRNIKSDNPKIILMIINPIINSKAKIYLIIPAFITQVGKIKAYNSNYNIFIIIFHMKLTREIALIIILIIVQVIIIFLVLESDWDLLCLYNNSNNIK